MDYQIGPRLRDKVGPWLRKPFAYKMRSVVTKAHRGLIRVEDVVFEKRHRLDCSGYIESHHLESVYSASLNHAHPYEAVRCAQLRELLKEAKKTRIGFDNFIDLGSGKGKACFYAATKCKFKQIVGVELCGPLFAVADANRRNFGAPNISFLNADAGLFTLPEGNNLVFLFNPFSERILQQFLENNLDHFRASRSVIAYANDADRLCIARLGFATLFRNQDTRGSLHQYM